MAKRLSMEAPRFSEGRLHDPNINMNDIDLKTGRTRINYAKVFKKDGDTIVGCYHNTRGLWAIAYHPGKNRSMCPSRINVSP
jgi:3-dehydroquinate dehydratase